MLSSLIRHCLASAGHRDGAGLTANYGNYIFVQDPGNATALTIKCKTCP